MRSFPVFKQDVMINRRYILMFFGIQALSLLLAAGICEMRLIEISDAFWDTIPVILVPGAMQMVLAYQIMQKRLQDGTMHFILSTQISPGRIVFAKMVFLVLNVMVLLIVSTVAGCFGDIYSLTGVWSQESYVALNLGAFCLQVFLGGYCFLISSKVKSLTRYLQLAVGVPVILYLLYLIYYLFPDLFFFKYLTVFTLFQQSLFAEGSILVWFSSLFFLAAGLVFFFLGRYCFMKRETPE